MNEITPFAIGPYEAGEELVCDASQSAYTIYAELANDGRTWHNGLESYSFKDLIAYKLDHVTKQATVLCDLTSYQGKTANKSKDGIMVIDDQHIYFARHTTCKYSGSYDSSFTVTADIMEFDHSGNLLRTVSNTGLCYNSHAGFSGDATYSSRLNAATGGNAKHTKNYIFWTSNGTGSSSSGSRNYFLFLLSKTSLKYIAQTYDGSKHGNPTTFGIYDTDIIYRCDMPSDIWEVSKLSESGFTTLLAATQNIIPNKLGQSYYYYLNGYNNPLRFIDGVRYYKLPLSYRYYASEDEEGNDERPSTTHYTVIPESAFNATTGTINITNVTTTNMPFGNTVYDVGTGEFKTNGYEFQVYPSYVAPADSETLPSGYSMTPFFRVNGYYYFLRASDNKVYRMKDHPQFLIERLREVE